MGATKRNAQEGFLNKNDLVTVEIIDIGTDGEGIGKVDGYPLFIKDAVIGDTVEARVTKTKKQFQKELLL